MTQKSTRKFHIESDNPADFLKQVGEQLQEMAKSEAKFQIEADTAVEFLKQVGNVVSKISFASLAKEPMEIEDYFAEAESLAKKLFYSAVVVDWNYSDYNDFKEALRNARPGIFMYKENWDEWNQKFGFIPTLPFPQKYPQ